ncbi:MAG: hypothetical protein AVDCRST_MAG38-2508, partial [uncultured Solirubrobacteraceae bacterium]
ERAGLPRAPGGRAGGRAAGPPPRPRRRRARPPRARRRARSRPPAACGDSRRPAADPRLAGTALVRRAARRASRCRDLPRRPSGARRVPRRAVGAHRPRSRADRVRRLLDGLRDELRARAGAGAPAAGRHPRLRRVRPDGRGLAAGSRLTDGAAGLHRPRAPGSDHGHRLRPSGEDAAGVRRPRRRLSRVRRRSPDRSGSPAGGDGLARAGARLLDDL